MSKSKNPKRILVLRFQATGDVVITLPFLQSLKNNHPKSEIHFVTRAECAAIPKAVSMFDKVIVIGGGRNTILQLLHVLLLVPSLWFTRYDVVIDLQNHWISQLIRKVLRAPSWSEFDKSSQRLAGVRTKEAIEAIGLSGIDIPKEVSLKEHIDVQSKLKGLGWDGRRKLIIINPAGAFDSRRWPLENYVAFARHWLEHDQATLFLIVGLSSLQQAADFLSDRIGKPLLNLCGKTTQLEAFQIVKCASLILTEDSGLMHMAWVQNVPTLALFGSSPSYWSAPMGNNSKCLHSSDLDCGNCMLDKCKFGDNRCLTRYTPELVFELSKSLAPISP